MQDLFSLIRQETSDDPFALPSLRTVRHRVQELTAAAVRTRGRMTEYRSGIIDPPGLKISRYDRSQIAVASWDKAAFDAATFTVAGLWERSTGRRARHKIAVSWVDVERWARNRNDIDRWASDNEVGAAAEPTDGSDMEAAPTASAPQVQSGMAIPDKSGAISDRTGAPGRPSSAHLVLQEFARRVGEKKTKPTLAAEAKVLSEWLVATHPGLARLKPTSVANSIRVEHRAIFHERNH